MDEMGQQGWRRVWSEAMARRSNLGVSLSRLYEMTGISEGTYKKMSEGNPVTYDHKRRSLCDGLGWSADSIDRILAGEPPIVEIPAQEMKTRDRIDRLEREVASLKTDIKRLAAMFPPAR